jgi:hypothetical protein
MAPLASASQELRRSAPGASLASSSPKRTPEIILIVTVACAVALLTMGSATRGSAAGVAGAAEGETEAAKSRKGPNIMRVIDQCAQHG